MAVVFFVVAYLYSSAGLAGGSSYTSLLIIWGLSTTIVPTISLTLNVLVSTVGSINFIRAGHASLKLILPFVLSSIPLAYVGGTLKLSPYVFQIILLVSLVFVAARIFFWKNVQLALQPSANVKLALSLFVGAMLGLLAGITGIGGGIYLVPLIIVLNLGTIKQAAACGVIFIWLNSLSGLISRANYNAVDISTYIPVIIAVVIGGFFGSFAGANKLPSRKMEKILGIIILVAIILLFKKIVS